MNIREATAQAHRELGKTDEEIKEIFAFSDRCHPEAIKNLEAEITVGLERDSIDHIKALLSLPKEELMGRYAAARAVLERDAANN